MVPRDAQEFVTVGRIGGVYGVLGWLKLWSDTEPKERIFDYAPWRIDGDSESLDYEVEAGRFHGRGLIVKFVGIDDRDLARGLTGSLIQVPVSCFPALPEGEFYWAQLIGLTVVHVDGRELGRVDRLMETGAHDVLVLLRGEQEILIPYVRGPVVKRVAIEEGLIEVDWDFES